jgi:DNA-binding NtrC family response regulator
MSGRAEDEVVLFGCHQDDAAVVSGVLESGGARARVVKTAVEVAHQAVASRPAAVFIGVGRRSVKNLDVIPVIQTAREGLPVIVIADADSLELERKARRNSIFYYLVRPLNRGEVAAVLDDVLRRARGRTSIV